MKRIALLALLVSQFVLAQTEKGTFVFSGKTGTDFSWVKSKTTYSNGSEEIKSTNFEFSPSFGYFVSNNVALGLSTTFEFDSTLRDKTSEVRTTTFAFMPYLGYYFTMEGKLRPFISGGVGLATYKNTFKTVSGFDPIINPGDPAFVSNFTSRGAGFAAAVAGGVSYFVVSNVSVDAQVGYNYLSLKDTSNSEMTTDTNGVGMRIGFSVFF